MEKLKDKIRVKVIMLPTESKSIIRKIDEINTLVFDPIMKFGNQHLYFISDREIKDFDYVVLGDGKTIHHMSPTDMVDYLESQSSSTKRIEASTDPSLHLPLIGEAFIQKYVKEQGDIKEVMIEMSTITWGGTVETTPVEIEKVVKMRKDYTVIISPIKDNWTREEVTELMSRAFNMGYNYKGSVTSRVSIDNWIAQNL